VFILEAIAGEMGEEDATWARALHEGRSVLCWCGTCIVDEQRLKAYSVVQDLLAVLFGSFSRCQQRDVPLNWHCQEVSSGADAGCDGLPRVGDSPVSPPASKKRRRSGEGPAADVEASTAHPVPPAGVEPAHARVLAVLAEGVRKLGTPKMWAYYFKVGSWTGVAHSQIIDLGAAMPILRRRFAMSGSYTSSRDPDQ
jgi:hypothetical protein